MLSSDSFDTFNVLEVEGKKYHYYSLASVSKKIPNIKSLPFSLKVLLENLLRFEDGARVTREDIEILANWGTTKTDLHEIAFRPARILMQDFTGVPAIVDLAAMREAMQNSGGDPNKINPLTPVDLVIDHSVQVDKFGSAQAFRENVDFEFERNKERYAFLRWGQTAFENFRVVPPGTGICHQVNLEFLAKAVWQSEVEGKLIAYPDTLVGTDSHTTMINGLGVLGWGVGGIEAEAAMLGQPVSMLIPDVIGFKLIGTLPSGTTATDLVLTITQMLRARGVVGKFVEFFGPGLNELPLPDRATVANMAPEYGATCGFFPIDKVTLEYMRLTGRDEHTLALVEAYTRAQGLWRDEGADEPVFTDTLFLDLASVVPSLAGPKRPQDRVKLKEMPNAIKSALSQIPEGDKVNESGLNHADVVIAAITSCTNTSNPSVLMAAGLVAKKAIERGLTAKPWVKASLAPGSKVVTSYLQKSNLQRYLDELGFNLVGYGCTTCIGNSGPLPEKVSDAIEKDNLWVCAVLSGNRNFEGRIHPQIKANWLASPPLVVAYALAGTTKIDFQSEPLGKNAEGEAIYLRDIWPSQEEIINEVSKIDRNMFQEQYADVFRGDADWQKLEVGEGQTYDWDINSTYIQHPPYFEGPQVKYSNIEGARILALFGDSITTDHISPAGSIKPNSPAGEFLQEHGVAVKDFNSYGARRGNHEVMMRGTFANIRIQNEMLMGVEGGYTKYLPTEEILSIYDAAIRYAADETPLVVIAGKEYGTGSSRDWAAKGTRLLGVKAVVAESFERIHRSNLIGMGVLPLEFLDNLNHKLLGLKGYELITIRGIDKDLSPRQKFIMSIKNEEGEQEVEVLSRLDTQEEIAYYQNGGILPYVLKNLT
ncbi:MAG: aconitate hydratase AcnA [Gammaproteobacteria bacterium]|nr:aconitate hydratase AcnA [Gammaproteobacteria bacterium]